MGFRGTKVISVKVIDRATSRELERAVNYWIQSVNVVDLQYALVPYKDDYTYSALLLIGEKNDL